jgi:hypothetical protein
MKIYILIILHVCIYYMNSNPGERNQICKKCHVRPDGRSSGGDKYPAKPAYNSVINQVMIKIESC